MIPTSIFIIYIIAYIIIAVSVIIILIILVNLFFLIITGVPYVAAPKKYMGLILDQLEIKPSTVIYDLGSGNGQFLFEALKKNPRKAIGYELSLWPFFRARLRRLLRGDKRVEFYNKNFLKADLGEADIVYIYLVSGVLLKLAAKLKHELKKGAVVAALGSPLPGWPVANKLVLNSATNYGVYFYQV